MYNKIYSVYSAYYFLFPDTILFIYITVIYSQILRPISQEKFFERQVLKLRSKIADQRNSIFFRSIGFQRVCNFEQIKKKKKSIKQCRVACRLMTILALIRIPRVFLADNVTPTKQTRARVRQWSNGYSRIISRRLSLWERRAWVST